MLEHDLTMYEDETTRTYISFPIYQVHTVYSMLFCVDAGVSHSRVGDKALERIFLQYGRRSMSFWILSSSVNLTAVPSVQCG